MEFAYIMKFSPKKRNILIIIIGILIIISVGFKQQGIKNFFYFVSEPIQKFFWNAGKKISGPIELISEIKELKRKHDELSLYNQELLSENTQLKALKRENEILRKALELELQKDFKLTLAEVIGRDISQDSLLINKGVRDGISEGMPVITEEKVLVGRIKESSTRFSKVLLISNQKSSFDVKIQEGEITGLLRGKGDFQLLLDLIPEDQEIKEGDLIETTSLGGIFPKGILVGKIQKILRSDIKSFQQAEVFPFFDVKNLETVFIITNF